MREDSSNPARNQVPTSVDELGLIDAIETSGYPLQGIVADKLNTLFGVTEEWGYLDRDTKEHRSLDVFAFRHLAEDRSLRVQPNLVLLIECKRSRHPYVFFKNVVDRPIPKFPSVAGLRYGHVSIYEQKGNRLIDAPGSMVAGLDKHPFIEPGPPKCAAFSRAIPNGKKVDLSGQDPFNSIVLPLVKAHDHTYQLYKPQEKPNCLYPTLILCISVVDAPMILVESPGRASDPLLTPWVRIVRQEANPDPHSWDP